MEEQSNLTTTACVTVEESSPCCPICYEEFHVDDSTSFQTEDSTSNSVEVTGSCEDILPSSATKRTILRNPKRRRFQVEGCGHEFCHECLAEHCKFAISNRKVPVPCPQVMSPHEEEEEDEEEKNSKTRELLQETSVTAVSSTTSSSAGSSNQHCLSSEMVQAILMVSPLFRSGRTAQEEKNTGKDILPNDKEEMEDLEEQSFFPEIQLSRTFSTQRMSSSSSSSASSSSSTSELSVSSLAEYWTKYLRIQRLKEDPSLLSCPKCDELVPPPSPAMNTFDQELVEQGVETIHHQHLVVDDNHHLSFQDLENPGLLPSVVVDKEDEYNSVTITNNYAKKINDNDNDDVQVLCYPQVICSSCQHCFCSIHGDIHSGMSCAEFSNTERARDMEQSEQAISRMSKRCSHDNCGAPIAKIAGCDHIICAHCHQDFCYKCGTHIYLSGKVIRSCSNCKQGFVDHRFYGQYRLRLLLILPIHLILSAIYIAVVGAVAVLTCGFGCCFGCGTIEPQSSLASGGPRQVNPGKGLFMAVRVICMPIEELIRDCGFLRENGDEIAS